ncbi:MAG: hypothetical protein JWL77_4953 [Chthonomonadaceae bacterium]|nr:hypothetical protein [Chthonomonadaceae bacterium]
MSRKRISWLLPLILIVVVGWPVYRAAHQSSLNHELILASAADDPWTVQTLLNQGADPNTIEDSMQRMGWQHLLDLLLHHNQGGSPLCPLSQALVLVRAGTRP